MVTESTPMVKRTHPEQYRFSMEPTGRAQSPTAEKVSSAADAMLKLSTSAPNLPVFVVNPEAVGMGSGLPTFGQPPVAYMAQKHDGAAVRTSSTTSSMDGELLDMKPDINGLRVGGSRISRKQREFIPEFKKDDHYWTKRRKNNEAAKRSREKRRMNDMALTGTISEVQLDNDKLRRELQAIKKNFGLPVDQPFPYDDQFLMQSTSDSSDNASSPRHMMPMVVDTSSSGPVFPSQISASPLQEALRQALPTQPAPASPAAPIQPRALSVSQTNSSPAIPFLIPVSSSNPQQPLALVTQIPTMAMPLNPAIVASLTLPPGLLTNQSPMPVGLTNGHDIDGGTHHYHNTNKSAAANAASSTDSYSDVYMDKAVASGGGQGAAAPFTNNHHPHHHHHQHSKQRTAVEATCQSPDNSPTGSLRIITSSGSDFSEEGDMAEGHYPRGINPLNLCKREKDDGLLPAYIEIKPCPLTPPINEKSSIPHKLRHKLAQHLRERVAFSMYPDEQVVSANEQLGGSEADSSMNCGLQVKQEDSSSSDGTTGSPTNRAIGRGNTSIDPKYTERRKRNNQAARKCRENRRAITDMRLAKSNVLETENQRLKEELQNLTSEVSTLKDLIELKNVAKAKGEPFEPPPMKKHKDSSSSPSSSPSLKSQTDSALSPK